MTFECSVDIYRSKTIFQFCLFFYIMMRSFQVMRNGRRPTLTNHDLAPPMRTSYSLQCLSNRQNSILSYPHEQNRDIQLSNDNNNLFRER